MANGVTVVRLSENAKLGQCAATYVSQDSCPASCPFFGKGCYAELGLVGIQTRRLKRQSSGNRLELAREESRLIDGLTLPIPLRLHVVGDSTTVRGTRAIAGAAKRYRHRTKAPVWSYTHAWRKVARKEWGEVSILASCETPKEAIESSAKGYAVAMVVGEHASAKAKPIPGTELKGIPCPSQTRGTTCDKCRLCFDSERLKANGLAITFAAHGTRKNMVKNRISLSMVKT